MRQVRTPQRWYGSLYLPDNRIQFVEARTLPRAQSIIDEAPEGAYESAWEVATDPVRASWPSR